MMERYYEQPANLRNPDVHPELYYQVGTTPEGVEKARDHCSKISKLAPNEKPYTVCPPEHDPKSRFFWRMGERPIKTEFQNLNAAPVIPKAFPEWEKTMNRWGGLMLSEYNNNNEKHHHHHHHSYSYTTHMFIIFIYLFICSICVYVSLC